ncbi:hypothetical protein RO3G_07633 [Rhizopus delemar RA 99-880]|uniref:Uncharacterized protein n=1 Tax=Rhizopus delemar (strain RA 99-880 / ATCC MYA-4621 / FGSC 9543 / NRRL 43880) TaxID=246409 RepID=I1C398_RHIO9|nr:hypothetical protein RO3G_07633 [Rhizopus delemar RA 99-880]|eukprot:EIE82928.1 hypothetical protein RO3G_07633 [Rhizopus delemar RA 99-880]
MIPKSWPHDYAAQSNLLFDDGNCKNNDSQKDVCESIFDEQRKETTAFIGEKSL